MLLGPDVCISRTHIFVLLYLYIVLVCAYCIPLIRNHDWWLFRIDSTIVAVCYYVWSLVWYFKRTFCLVYNYSCGQKLKFRSGQKDSISNNTQTFLFSAKWSTHPLEENNFLHFLGPNTIKCRSVSTFRNWNQYIYKWSKTV